MKTVHILATYNSRYGEMLLILSFVQYEVWSGIMSLHAHFFIKVDKHLCGDSLAM